MGRFDPRGPKATELRMGLHPRSRYERNITWALQKDHELLHHTCIGGMLTEIVWYWFVRRCWRICGPWFWLNYATRSRPAKRRSSKGRKWWIFTSPALHKHKEVKKFKKVDKVKSSERPEQPLANAEADKKPQIQFSQVGKSFTRPVWVMRKSFALKSFPSHLHVSHSQVVCTQVICKSFACKSFASHFVCGSWIKFFENFPKLYYLLLSHSQVIQ